jgi:hypothetical protein
VLTFTKRRICWHADQQILKGELPVYSDFLESCGIEWPRRHMLEEELQAALTLIYDTLAPR